MLYWIDMHGWGPSRTLLSSSWRSRAHECCPASSRASNYPQDGSASENATSRPLPTCFWLFSLVVFPLLPINPATQPRPSSIFSLSRKFHLRGSSPFCLANCHRDSSALFLRAWQVWNSCLQTQRSARLCQMNSYCHECELGVSARALWRSYFRRLDPFVSH